MSARRRSSALVLCSSLVATLWFVAAPPAGAVNIAHPSVANADPSNLTPDIENGRVNALAQVGNWIIVGGTFTTVQNPGSDVNISRPYVVAFNASTGVVDTGFTPSLDGAVEALAPAPDGTSVFVGGSFTTVNGTGTNYRRLVRLNVSNGAIVPGLQPRPNRVVTDLVVRGPWLYASGEFDVTTPLTRVGLARFNVNTGAMDPNLDIPFTDPNNVPERDPAKDGVMQVWKIDVTPDGSRLIAIGNFNTVGGIHREQLAILDVAAGTPGVTSWQTDVFPFRVPGTPTSSYCNATFPMYLRDIDIAPDGSYFAIVTTGANRPNRLCDSLTRWEIGPQGPGQVPTWFMKTGGDSMHSVSVTGAAIYAGGHQQWANNPFNPRSCGVCDGPYPGGVVRTGISAHDPINGLPFTFNPGRARGKGVLAQLSSNLGIYFGSDTDTIGGETHRKLAFMPLAGGVVVPPNDPYTLPGDLFRMDRGSGDLIQYQFDGTSPPILDGVVPSGIDWTNARGAFALNGLVYTGWSDGTLTVRAFDGSTLGGASTIDLHGLDVAPDPVVFTMQGANLPIPALDAHLAAMTGMAFDQGRIYYTVSGDPRLYYRYFTPESRIVGAELFVASTGDGVDWANVDGFTIASGQMFFALSNGSLNRVAWSDGHPTGPVTQILAPGSGWGSRGLFAFDATGAPPPPPPPDAVFADDFSGGMSEWDFVTRMAADPTRGATAPPSARAAVSGQSGWAAALLPSSETSACVSLAVNVQSASQATDLMRVRTAGNGNVAKVLRYTNGTLRFRSDVSGVVTNTGVTLPTAAWHTIELCGTVGTSGTWDMWLDGTQIMTGVVANTGTTGIGRVQIGDNASKTFTVNFDDVVVDHDPG